MLRVKLPYAVSDYLISALIVIKIYDLKAFCAGIWAAPATFPQILDDSQQVTSPCRFWPQFTQTGIEISAFAVHDYLAPAERP